MHTHHCLTRSRARRRSFPALFVLGLAAYGGGVTNAAATRSMPTGVSTEPPPALTEAEFAEQGNAACAAANAAIEQGIGELFAGDITPEAMGRAQALIVGETLIAAAVIGSLAAPDSVRAQVDTLLAEVRSSTAAVAGQDPETYFNSEEYLFAEVDRLALELGLDACAGEGDSGEGTCDAPESVDAGQCEIDPDATLVDVTATEYHFTAAFPDAAGRYSFVLANAGAEPHMMIIVQLDADVTLDEAMASQGEVGVLAQYVSRTAAPGEEAVLTIDLAPGRWIVVCPIADHADLGMVHELIVT